MQYNILVFTDNPGKWEEGFEYQPAEELGQGLFQSGAFESRQEFEQKVTIIYLPVNSPEGVALRAKEGTVGIAVEKTVVALFRGNQLTRNNVARTMQDINLALSTGQSLGVDTINPIAGSEQGWAIGLNTAGVPAPFKIQTGKLLGWGIIMFAAILYLILEK